ncbi:TetR/AcrR family transcriptional regulator [Pseudarthrobacter sp. J1738]|uniref:TetR/AcrR family transcriptional regulator n=1 Tax=Pseudarthrobacter sp. J1738 TaxID=3420446 RepID=UPI003D296E49
MSQLAANSAATAETKRLRPARTNATRQKLFDAAMHLIGERGASGVTVDEIAAAAGVSKGTVYYNFGSKSDLVAQLVRHGVDLMLEQLAETKAAEDPIESTRNMIDQAIQFLSEYPSFARLWVSENWKIPSEWHEVFTELRGKLLAVIGEALDGIALKYPVNPKIARGSLETAIFGASFVVGLDVQTYHPERTRAQSVDAIMTFVHGYVLP